MRLAEQAEHELQYQIYLKQQLQELMNNPSALGLEGGVVADPETLQKIAELQSVLEELVA